MDFAEDRILIGKMQDVAGLGRRRDGADFLPKRIPGEQALDLESPLA